jgi:hypothetical protein
MRDTTTTAGNRIRTKCSPYTICSSKVPIRAATDVSAASTHRIRNNLPRHDNKRLIYFKTTAAAAATDVGVSERKVKTCSLITP